MKKIISLMLTLSMLLGCVILPAYAGDDSTKTVQITPVMTYVNYDEPDTAYGYIAAGSTAYTGYNKLSNGSIGFGNTGWGVNRIAYLKLDASGITDTIVSASLTLDAGKISGRGASYGLVAVSDTSWDNTLTYNTAKDTMLKGTAVGETQSVSSGTGTASISFDIGDAIISDDDKIVTLAVYQTSAGGGSIANPSVSVTTTTDTDFIQPIKSVAISGASNMTLGDDPDTPYSNPYTVIITGSTGGVITEDNISSKVTDFNVKWDIDGFKTENDTEGQYCDSYGSFSDNNSAKVATNFDLCGVSMNFFGKMTATVTYNGETYTASQYVTALGNTARNSNVVFPSGGYPSNIDEYPESFVGYSSTSDSDPILGGWRLVGSGGPKNAISADENGDKYLRITGGSGSHVAYKTFSAASQTIFEQDVRFGKGQGAIKLTGSNAYWISGKYNEAVNLSFDGTNLMLSAGNDNSNTILRSTAAYVKTNSTNTVFSANTWYRVVISSDPSTKLCYAKVYDLEGNILGETDIVSYGTDCVPSYFTIDPGNSGQVDIDNYKAYYTLADVSTYELTSTKDTLSIPAGDTAQLEASLSTAEGYPLTGAASWSILEEDMAEGITITPDESDSHKATVAPSGTAEAGEATVQVNIGGYTKTIALRLTSPYESVKFIKSNTSVAIPLDENNTTAEYKAIVADGNGTDLERDVAYAIYDKNNESAYTLPGGITFEDGVLTVTKDAPATVFTIRATGKNSDNADISKALKVTVHGLSFDFGSADSDAAEGYTPVSPSTTYTEARGYGIASGTTAAGGTASADASSDYLEGGATFKAKVQKGKCYTVKVTYQGTLTTGYINSDLAGYELGSKSSLTTETYTVAVPVDTLDLNIADYTDGGNIYPARIAEVVVTKDEDKTADDIPNIYHVGDSTSANSGSWAYRIAHNTDAYAKLYAVANFHNNGAGSRNLATYYTEGKLASVLKRIKPGDIFMLGNMGTNNMRDYFEDDFNYYLDAAEAMGAKIIINSYTPHGAVGNYTSGYNAETHTFDSYRKDKYDNIARQIAEERAAGDENYIGFVEIGKQADKAFNAYVQNYENEKAKDGSAYTSMDEAAARIIACFSDHNHYYAPKYGCDDTLAGNLMLDGYDYNGEHIDGIVDQLITLLTADDDDPSDKKFTVTFDYGGGETAERTVAEGGKVTDIPAPPEKDIIKLADGHGNSGVLIKAVYKQDKTLESASVVNESVTLTSGQTEYDLPAVNENEKYFLWNSLSGMKPLGATDKKKAVWSYNGAEFDENTAVTDNITVTPSYDDLAEETEKTASITIKYADEEKNKIKDDVTYSEEYKSGDIYSVPDEYKKDFIVKTQDGMYNHYTFNSGTSDIPAAYSENMTVTLVFNNDIQYDYYEDFENYKLDTSKWHEQAASVPDPTVETDHTRYIYHKTGSSTTGGYMTFDEVDTTGKKVHITADVKFTEPTGSSKGNSQITICNTSPTFSGNNITWGINDTSAGHIIALEYNSGSTFKVNNVTADTGFIGDWVHMEADADFGSKEVSVTLTNGNGKSATYDSTIYSKTFDKNIGAFYMRSAGAEASTSIDNITVRITGNGGEVVPEVESVINFKSVYAFGDSIVYGHNAPKQSFMSLIAADYAMDLNMMAKNGATIMPSSNRVLTQINNAPTAEPDIVVFEGYTNDAYGSAESDPEFNPDGSNRDVTQCYGEITADGTTTFDNTTFCGAFEETISAIKTKWPGSKVVFVTIHKSGARKLEIQQKLRELSMEMCDKWGVEVVDMFTYENSEGNILDTTDSAQMAKYMIGGKGSHPNVTACREFYIPAVVGKLEALLDNTSVSNKNQ